MPEITARVAAGTVDHRARRAVRNRLRVSARYHDADDLPPYHRDAAAHRDLRESAVSTTADGVDSPDEPHRADGPLESGHDVELSVKAHNYRRVDSGVAFDMTTDVVSSGSSIWRETCCFMSRWSQPSASAGRPPRPPKAPKDAVVLTEREVTLRTAWDYARVAGDFNPIHLHEGAARKFGLRGAIVHGMWSLAFSLAQSPRPELNHRSVLETEFLTPVQLPGKVAVKEWVAEGRTRRALCDVRTGRVHMYAHWVTGG